MEQPEIERLTRGVTVQRAQKVSHRCLCVLLVEQPCNEVEVLPDGKVGIRQHIRVARDACTGWSDIPDSPLCRDCIAAGHDVQNHVPYTEVQASRQEVT
jgi:hypothetical protein